MLKNPWMGKGVLGKDAATAVLLEKAVLCRFEDPGIYQVPVPLPRTPEDNKKLSFQKLSFGFLGTYISPEAFLYVDLWE